MSRCAAAGCHETATVEVRMGPKVWRFCSVRCLCRRMFEVWAAVDF